MLIQVDLDPVVIDITKDAQFGSLDFSYTKQPKIRSYFPKPKLSTEEIDAAAELINNAKRPFILAGHGIQISHAQAEFKTFAEKAEYPLAALFMVGDQFLKNTH